MYQDLHNTSSEIGNPAQKLPSVFQDHHEFQKFQKSEFSTVKELLFHNERYPVSEFLLDKSYNLVGCKGKRVQILCNP
jgi:hypothetical protein